jgi:outer membrane receptor protein involved in Fe transport
MRFDIPPGPVAEAVLAVARQGGVSVGLGVACHGQSAGVAGVLTVEEALERVLAGSDCRAAWADATVVRIERRPRPKPPAPAPAPADLAEVVVTAAKREVVALDLAGSVSVVTASALAATHGVDDGDLKLLVSGLTVTNLGPGRDKVLLRGLSDGAFTGHTQSSVGIYWDEAPITYNAPDPDLRLVDIQSVDVLRGPQGTLYGAGAIGGVLNVTPNKPQFGGVSGSLAAEGSATANGAPSGEAEGIFNTPLAGGRAALRLVAYGEEDGGYISEPLIERRDVNGVQRVGVRAALSLQIDPSWIATLGETYQDIYSADTQYTTGAPDGLTRDTRIPEPHDNDFEHLYLEITGRGGWGDLKSVGSLIHHEFDSRYDASDAAALFGGAEGATEAYDEDTLVRLVSEEVDYHAPQLGRLKLLAGAYGDYGDERQLSRLGAPDGASTLYHEDRTDRLVDLALFGEADYEVTRRLELSLGLRAFYASRHTLSQTNQPSGQDAFEGRISWSHAAPRLSVRYQVARGASIYALASEGYRAGGFNTAGPVGQDFNPEGGAQPNRTYRPDELWNYEVGAAFTTLGGRFEARTAVYYDFWRGLQADQFLPSGLPYVANVGDARVYGWEWEATARPIRNLTLAAGALFTAPDLNQVNSTFLTGRSDFTLPGVPRRSINGRIAYDIPLGEARALSLEAVGAYVGHSYLFFGPAAAAVMGEYMDARLQASFRAGKTSLALFVSNPADSRGDTFAFGNPFSLSAAAQRTPLRPRTVGLRVSREF